MSTAPIAALALFQSGDASAHDIHLLTVFVGLIALALIVAAIGMVLIAAFAAKVLHRVDGITKEIKERTGPLLDKTQALVADLTPKIQTFTTNAEHISTTVRTKVDELAVTVTQLNATVQHINGRTQVHVAQADGIVTDALLATAEISATVQQGIKAPLRQIVGVVAGVRAGLEKLVQMSPFGR
jgi:methyl-accepting chemotaxis protein